MKTALLLCSCGPHVGERLDLVQIRNLVCQLRPQVVVCPFDFLCATDGSVAAVTWLKQEQPERVVIAACSPCDREAEFQNLLTAAGIDRGFLQIANIREQGVWVTPDSVGATDKVLRMICAAIDRVALHEVQPLRVVEVCQDVLVLGGGPAGLTAAVTMAAAGRNVVLVEQSAALGGWAARQDRLEPSGECGSCLMTPLISRFMTYVHSGAVELFTATTIGNVAGYFGRFVVPLHRTCREVDPKACIGCGACVAVCPAQVEDGRRAIDFAFPGAVPAIPSIDQRYCLRSLDEGCSLCRDACPLGPAVIDFGRTTVVEERVVGAVIVAIGGDEAARGVVTDFLGIGRDGSELRYLSPGLDPLRLALKGVYWIDGGAATDDVSLAGLRGMAAAGAVQADLGQNGMVVLEGTVARVRPERCSGCRLCGSSCPYQAIGFDDAGRCAINELLCRGCGGCSAACPAGALELEQYTQAQLAAEVRGLLRHG